MNSDVADEKSTPASQEPHTEKGLRQALEGELLTDEQVADILAHVRGLTGDAETYPRPLHGWTCFHCGETFKTPGGGRLHFGAGPQALPDCLAARASRLEAALTKIVASADSYDPATCTLPNADPEWKWGHAAGWDDAAHIAREALPVRLADEGLAPGTGDAT